MLVGTRLAACLLVAAPTSAQEAAHPIVSGAAGPYAKIKVVLTRPTGAMGGPFSGVVRVGARRIALVGKPEEPAGFFHLMPQAVLFTPVDHSRRNGIVILYTSSRIGPGHGTDHRALVYRLERSRAVRLPALEERLEGARDAAAARRHLRAAPRRRLNPAVPPGARA